MANIRIAVALGIASLTFMGGGGGAWAAPENPLAAPSDSFAGTYAGNRLVATFVASGHGAYTGQIKLGDKTYPIQASLINGKIHGKFSSGANAFEFTATLNGRTLSFSSGGSDYTLERTDQAANPLEAPANSSSPAAAPANANPPAASPAPADNAAAGASTVAPLPDVPLPKGFSELGNTPSGRSIFSNFTDVHSVDDLIQHVGDAIGTMLGDKPRFGSACVDAKNRNGGVATFTATLKGAPIKGVVFFGFNPQGASSATIIYARPDTPHDEFAALMQTVPAQPKMHIEQMPDGSGSIDIPEGWTCKSQSMTAASIFVVGPHNEAMIVGGMFGENTPDSTAVQQAKRTHDLAVNFYRMSGGRGAPPKPLEFYLSHMDISPYAGPEGAFKLITAKLQNIPRQAGKPWPEYGDIKFKQVMPANSDINEAEIIGTTICWHDGDKVGPENMVIMKLNTSKPDALGVWHIRVDQYVAPKALAARDFPLMVQIYNSIDIPQAAVKRQLDKDDRAFQSVSAYFRAKNEALLARGREFQINQKEHFERFEQQQAAQSQARHDACSDMIESSLGVRDVLDTATGQMHQVDLYNSTAITDTLNGLANDPNRFLQIPLRYER